MKPIKFKEANIVFAEDQPEYIPLPAFRSNTPEGQVISCWTLSFRERIKVLFKGKIWLSLMMFGAPLAPSIVTTKKTDVLTTAQE